MDPDSNLEAMRQHYAERRRQHERELGEGIARLLGLKPREPEPERPRLTPRRIESLLTGRPDYEQIEAERQALEANVTEDARRIAARNGPGDREWAAGFARHHGLHDLAREIETNREDD